MALSHAITAYGIVTKAQSDASSAITKAQQNPTARNILLADTARNSVGEAMDNYNYWITTVPAKDQSKVPPIPEWNPQEYGQLTQQQADQFGVTTQRPTESSPSAPSIPAYIANPKTDSEYTAAVKYYAQQNGLNITDNDIKTIAYAFSGNPNVSSIVESMRGGDLDESHPFHPKNAAINYANNKQQVVDDAIKNLTLNVVQNQYAVGMGGGASGPNDAAVAVENASKQLEEFIGNAVRAGLATPENVQNIVDKTVSFYQDAIDQFAKERESGLFPKIVSFAANAIVAAGSGGLSLPKQLAIRAAMSLASGANPSDIARDVVGTLAAAQIGGDSKIGAINDFNEAVAAIKSPELQSAIFNGARQGVYSTVTQQDIAKNMAAGALAGAIATNVQGKYKDPALSNAVGEFVQAKIAGKSDFEAISAAMSGFATEEQKANAKKVISEEISGLPLEQVQALGYKTQDEITGSFFPEEKPPQDDVYGGAGTEGKKLPSVVVTAQRDFQNVDGLNLIRTVRTGREVDEGGKLPTVEVTAQREEDLPEPQRLITESTQEATQKETEVQRPATEPVLLGLLGGGRGATIPRTQRTPNEREAASMQALSQALSVGDAGDALFGSGLGRRKNVWNVESLRLKDELGG
jgi:hypothetical protein